MKTHVKEQNQLCEWALIAPLAQVPQPFRRVTKIKMAAE
jgi:hypothetical protein